MSRKYKIDYQQTGGAGAPIVFSTGSNHFSLSGYSQLMKLYNILDKEEYKYMSKIKDMIFKFNTKISDFNSRYVINVSDKELKVLQFIQKKLLN